MCLCGDYSQAMQQPKRNRVLFNLVVSARFSYQDRRKFENAIVRTVNSVGSRRDLSVRCDWSEIDVPIRATRRSGTLNTGRSAGAAAFDHGSSECVVKKRLRVNPTASSAPCVVDWHHHNEKEEKLQNL